MQLRGDSKHTAEAVKIHMLANWEKSDEMRKGDPEFAIAWRRVFLTDKDRTPN